MLDKNRITGGASVPHLRNTDVQWDRIKLANLPELVTNVEVAIERPLEYRTALITAAVTGKIDVRGASR